MGAAFLDCVRLCAYQDLKPHSPCPYAHQTAWHHLCVMLAGLACLEAGLAGPCNS